MFPPRPFFIWNASASVPIGLYFIRSNSALKRRDLVAVWLPDPMRILAAKRRYLPYNVPALKRIIAIQGDRICAKGPFIMVNGKQVTVRALADSNGRIMPLWEGCKTLSAGDVFLLNVGAVKSFDGRYIGITKTSDLIGKAVLLCAA